MSPRTLFIANALISLIVVAGALLAYDRQVIRPARTIGVVDLAEVYRAREDEFTRRLTAARSEEERQATLQMARSFAQRLPVAQLHGRPSRHAQRWQMAMTPSLRCCRWRKSRQVARPEQKRGRKSQRKYRTCQFPRR